MFRLQITTLILSVEPKDVHNRHAFCFCDTRNELLNVILMFFSILSARLYVSHILCVWDGKKLY
jgi:hypothetical protein